jgi:alginate O-acetyltransferase complex protein AlgI
VGFHSLTYAAFFLVVLAVHRATARHGPRIGWLLLSSFVFYASWSLPFSLLLAATLVIDHSVALAMTRWPARRRPLMLASVVANLGVLAGFKYGRLLAGTIGALVGRTSAEPGDGWILPLGISFYTFQSLGYVVDVYRGDVQAIRSLPRFALFVTFFPQLVAGPIVRARELAPQFDEPRRVGARDVQWGLHRIALGLFKKIVIADWLAAAIRPVFADPGAYPPAASVLAVYGFAFQVLCDFGAYCDIGIGSARILGYRLPENFERPYLAPNLAAFWRRWHVTLGAWFRDYVYRPLGGRRGGTFRTHANLLATMTLAGIWHGASWRFAIWGAVCGALLSIERLLGRRGESGSALVTFNLHAATLVLFRAPSTDAGLGLYAHVAGGLLGGATWVATAAALASSAVLLLVYRACCDLSDRIVAWRPTGLGSQVAYAGAFAALVLILAGVGSPTADFVYFQF